MASRPCRANVCLVCGDKAMVERFIFCTECRDSGAHSYCLGFSPDDGNINWLCWDCTPNAEPVRQSERISTKRQNALNNRGYWKHKLNQKKHHFCKCNENRLPTTAAETQDNIRKQRRPEPIISNNSHFCNTLIRTDEPALERETILPSIEESSPESSDRTQKTQDVVKRNRIRDGNNSTKCQEEYKAIDNQILPLAVCTASGPIHTQHPLKYDYYFDSEPVTDPIWRGLFNIGEGTGACLEIVGHLSIRACQKASDAATAIPYVLDIQVMDKQGVWPNSFRTLPPTTACIALYFFPASQRVELAFDTLLDEVIEGDLALKAMTPAAELLIFSSRELPQKHWRYHRKYYLWGVFRSMRCPRLPHDSDILSIQPTSSPGSYLNPAEAHINHSDDESSSTSDQSNQGSTIKKYSQVSHS